MSISIRPMNSEDLERMMAEHRELNPDRPVRADIKEALGAYGQSGHRLGNFLTAVVENDLFEAIGRADSYNLATICQICRYVYNELPANCWGSPAVVKAHYARFKSNSEETK